MRRWFSSFDTRAWDVLFAASCLVMLALGACAIDFAPWMDEVHIVEMGRLVRLAGPTEDSILFGADGRLFVPIYYLGPWLHDLAFRLCGVTGVRLLPLAALVAGAAFFRYWLMHGRGFGKGIATSLGLFYMTMPLFVQSVRLVRPDCGVLAVASAVLALIDAPLSRQRRLRIALAAALAAMSPFIWPTAVFLMPLYAVVYFERAQNDGLNIRSELADMALACVIATLTAAMTLAPVANRLTELFGSLAAYFSSAGATAAPGESVSLIGIMQGVAILLVKEILREPFLYALLPLGFAVAIRRRKTAYLATFTIVFVAAVASKLHTFRFVYLYPYLLLLAAEGAQAWHARHRSKCTCFLAAAIAYGFITGPIALAWANRGRAEAYEAFVHDVANAVGTKQCAVLSMDYRCYYLARSRGWRLRGYAEPQITCKDPRHLLDTSDTILVADENPRKAVEECYAFYGLLRDLLLQSGHGDAFAFSYFTPETRTERDTLLHAKGFRPHATILQKPFEGISVWTRKDTLP